MNIDVVSEIENIEVIAVGGKYGISCVSVNSMGMDVGAS